MLTKDERDALYVWILNRLVAIEDLWLVIKAENYEEADRLGYELSDSVRLILNDLGWGFDGEAVGLSMPAEDLRRIFGLFNERAARALVTEECEEAEVRAHREDTQLVMGACKKVLTTLDVRAMG